MQVKFHPMVKLVTLGSGNFKDSYTKRYVCSHKLKIENTLNRFFILSPVPCPRGGTWDVGVKNFCVGVCDGGPSTVRSRF